MMTAVDGKVPARARLGILISGQGSNMQALIAGSLEPGAPYDVAGVISNRPEAPGLTTAATSGIPALAIAHAPFGEDREAHERAIDAALKAWGCTHVALAGYMRLLTPFLVEAWAGRMVNIHPSLLPLYPGLNTHQRAIDAGDQEHGCSVHLVTAGVDEGPVIAQARVPILPDDTADTLSARVLAAEHRLYPAAVAEWVMHSV